MKQLANNQFQMNIIYGDTDSIFASGVNRDQHSPVDAFITTCKQKLGVDVDHQNTDVNMLMIRIDFANTYLESLNRRK